VTEEIAIVLATLGLSFFLFAREWLPVDLVALLVVLCLVLTGILDADQALEGFGHPAVIGVGALFIISEGLLRTGALGVVGNRLAAWSRGEKNRLVILLLVTVALASSFLNNTPVVAMFVPVVLGLSRRCGITPSKILIPVSFAAILGGTCTLIGTSTNIMVASIVESHEGLRPLGMFEFTKLGIILTAAGLAYLILCGQRLLPERPTITSITYSTDRRLRDYVTELGIRPGGTLSGKPFAETPIARAKNVRIVQIIRGEEILWPPFDRCVLRGGDALVIAGRVEHLVELHKEPGLQTLDEILDTEEVDVATREAQLAEILVLPNSAYAGMRLEDARFRRRFRITVVGIQRHGLHLRRKISQLNLKVGDVLLVQGAEADFGRIAAEEGLVLMSGVADVIVRAGKAPIAIAILAGVIACLSLQLLSMVEVALAGALAMVITGCLPASKVYEAVHWRVLILIAGMLALGTAMEETGAASWIAGELVELFSFGGPHAVLVVTLVLTTLLTECVSNTAVAAIMIPIALKIAPLTEAAPYPFIMAVAFGASCSFLTPIGYQTNTLVYGAGGYRFSDFFRVGAGLILLIWILGGVLIPVFWPF
jgi:di/tricarboxylate transporter